MSAVVDRRLSEASNNQMEVQFREFKSRLIIDEKSHKVSLIYCPFRLNKLFSFHWSPATIRLYCDQRLQCSDLHSISAFQLPKCQSGQFGKIPVDFERIDWLANSERIVQRTPMVNEHLSSKKWEAKIIGFFFKLFHGWAADCFGLITTVNSLSHWLSFLGELDWAITRVTRVECQCNTIHGSALQSWNAMLN